MSLRQLFVSGVVDRYRSVMRVLYTFSSNISHIICLSQFDKIFQSTAKISYFRFRKRDGRHIGILLPVLILTYL